VSDEKLRENEYAIFSKFKLKIITMSRGPKKSLISNYNHFNCTQAFKLKFNTDIYYINVVPH